MKKIRRVVWTTLTLSLLFLGNATFAQETNLSEELQTYLNSKAPKKQKPSHQSRDWFYTGLEINYIALNAADLITTFYGLDKGAKEANPVARLVIHNRPAAVVFKSAMTAGVLLGLAHVKKQNQPAAYVTLSALNVLYGFVVHNNIGVYLNLK